MTRQVWDKNRECRVPDKNPTACGKKLFGKEVMWEYRAFLILLIIIGCVTKEAPVKTFTSRMVAEDNVFSYGSVKVKVSSELDYLNISGSIKKKKFGNSNDPTKREFHIFIRPGINKIVLIETHTRSFPNTFRQSQSDLTKKISTIHKGRKPIDGKTWEVYIRALPEFPTQILSAARQKGIRIEPYRCGMEIGFVRAIDPFSRIYIYYIEGVDKCESLPQNGSILGDEQVGFVQDLIDQFYKYITISDQSVG